MFAHILQYYLIKYEYVAVSRSRGSYIYGIAIDKYMDNIPDVPRRYFRLKCPSTYPLIHKWLPN